MMPQVVTRFAPSPTGRIHIGNLRAAIWNFCFAKQQGGRFLLRIEDTDLERSRQSHADDLIETLHQFGLEPDSISYQSQRRPFYQKSLESLLERDLAYPCFCTDATLEADRKAQASKGEAPRYVGRCRNLSAGEREKRQHEPHCYRLRIDPEASASYEDLVFGPRTMLGRDLGDFVLCRSDGAFSFLFVNLVDDHDMGVTHILRGSDHLTNALRQEFLRKAMGFPSLAYGHLPLIIKPNGQPLSKRDGFSGVGETLASGILPSALLNYLYRLGFHEDHQALLSLSEMTEHFDIAKVSRASAVFDETHLMHWQKLSLSQSSNAEKLAWAHAGLSSQRVQGNASEPQILWALDGVADHGHLSQALSSFDPSFIAPQAITYLQSLEPSALKAYLEAYGHLIQNHTDYTSLVHQLQHTLNLKGAALFKPLRILLTGRLEGGSLEGFFRLVDQDFLLSRLQSVLSFVKMG